MRNCKKSMGGIHLDMYIMESVYSKSRYFAFAALPHRNSLMMAITNDMNNGGFGEDWQNRYGERNLS